MLARGWQPVRVPRFEPFAATRATAPDLALDDVTAPPYDVLSDADVDALARTRRAQHRAHRRAPRGDGPGRYVARRASVLRAWLADGDAGDRRSRRASRSTGCASSTPTGAARDTVGVIGALEVVDEGAGGVLPHERTTPKASTDRLDLTRATEANLSPVWGLSLAAGLTALLAAPGEPLGSVHRRGGVVHTVERVTDPDRVGADRRRRRRRTPSLIADGHHRYAISRTYRDERRAAAGRRRTRRADDDLRRRARGRPAEHRGDPPPVHRHRPRTRWPTRWSATFDISTRRARSTDEFAAEAVRAWRPVPRAARRHRPVADPPGRGVRGRARPRRRAGSNTRWPGSRPRSATSTAWPRSTGLVTSGAVDAAVLIRPTSIAEIRRTARRAAADAAEVDVLHAQAAHRAGPQVLRLKVKE